MCAALSKIMVFLKFYGGNEIHFAMRLYSFVADGHFHPDRQDQKPPQGEIFHLGYYSFARKGRKHSKKLITIWLRDLADTMLG